MRAASLYGERLVRSETRTEASRPARLSSGEEKPYGFGWRLAQRQERDCVWRAGRGRERVV